MCTFKRTRFIPLLITVLSLTLLKASTANDDLKNRVRTYRMANEHAIFQEYFEFLSIPNVASDRENIRRNAAVLKMMMEKRGINTRLLEPPSGNGAPAVYGEIKSRGARRTIVFYAHYDGQPADPSKWIESKPWEPILRTASLEAGGERIPISAYEQEKYPRARIYCRSSSDDKAPIVSMMAALDALRAAKLTPGVNIKFFFDGEEEAGSPNMEAILLAHKDLLKSDGWLIFDGPVHQNGQKLIYYGVRGIITADITIYGATRDLHSGHYGNWAPNPALMMSHLLASMKDEDGRVLVEGFYDDVEPLGEEERAAIARLPEYDKTLMDELNLSATENPGKQLGELIMLPSLTINGISSGFVGTQARTSIPSTATARIDMRLVKGNDPYRQFDRLKEHIRVQGYAIVEHEPKAEERKQYPRLARVTTRGGYKAFRTSMSLPLSRDVFEAIQQVSDRPVVEAPTLGGSVPLSFIPDIFGVPVIGVPIVNHDNNQHSENENLRVQNLWDGIEIVAALMRLR